MTAATIDSVPAVKLPIWRSVKAAYRDIFRNFPVFVTAAALPLVLSVALDIAVPDDSDGTAMMLLQAVASSLVSALFELAWLRFLLLGPAAGRPSLLPAFGRRLLLYLGYSLILLLLFIPTLLLVHGFGDISPAARHWQIIVALVVYVAAIYLSIRFSFVYLWIAIDAPHGLRQSWCATAGNGGRIMITLLLVAIPLAMTAAALLFLAAVISRDTGIQTELALYQGQMLWVVYGAGEVLAFFLYAASCGVLAEAFRVITGWEGDRRELLERFE